MFRSITGVAVIPFGCGSSVVGGVEPDIGDSYAGRISLDLRGLNRVVEVGYGMDNNCVAISMVTGMGLAFFVGMGAERWWQKLLAFGAALLMFHVVLISFSRGGMLGILITGVIACARQDRHV